MYRPNRIHVGALAVIFLVSFFVAANAPADFGIPTPSLQILEPVEGDHVVFQRLAPSGEGTPDQGRISIWLRVSNPTAEVLTVDRVEILGQVMTDFDSLTGTDADAVEIQPGGTWDFQNCRCFDPDLVCGRCIATEVLIVDAPYPNSAKVEVYLKGEAEPLSETVNLEIHDNNEDPLAYIGRADDLTFDELWTASSNHVSDHQVFALDIGLKTWDPAAQDWTGVYPGANKYEKESYPAYGKPIYAMAPGRVCSAINDHTEPELVGCGTCGTGSPDPAGGDPVYNGGGNEIFIRTGDEISVYAHLQPGSIPPEYLTPGAPVKRGAYIGKLGFSGATSGPHIHVHVKKEHPTNLDCDAGPFRPMQFNDVSSLTQGEAEVLAENGTLTKSHWTNLPQHSFSHAAGTFFPSPEGFEQCLTCTDDRDYFAVWREGTEIDIRAKVEGFDAFAKKWASLRDDRFHLIDVQYMREAGRDYYVGIFRRGARNQGLYQQSGWTAFAERIESERQEGRELIDVDTFLYNGQRAWLGTFHLSDEEHLTRDIVGYEAFATEWLQLHEEGFPLIDLEIYFEDGQPHFFGVFRPQDGVGQNLIQYEGFNDFAAGVADLEGYHPVDVETYVLNGDRWYVGILHPGSGGLAQLRSYDLFQQWDERARNDGAHLVDIHVLE